MSFAEALRVARERRNLTVSELAARLGLHRRLVQRWERGTAYPYPETLPLIEAELGAKLPRESR